MKFTLVKRKILGPKNLANAKILIIYKFIILKHFFEEIGCNIFAIFNILCHCTYYNI